MKALLIRADAGGELGSGHVMRMIALAQAWIEEGGDVTMVTVQCPEKLAKRLHEEGIHHAKLHTTVIGSDDDLAETRDLADRLGCKWIVLDGYEFQFDYQKGLTETDRKLLVMDDFLYSPEWCADLIVNQNPDCDPDGYVNKNPGGQVLRGSDYVLLRKEFWSVPIKSVPSEGSRKLLVSMGGVDADNLTGLLIEILNEVIAEPLEIRAILGAGNPHEDELKRLVIQSPHQIELHMDVREMSAMYAWADLVITAAGGTIWEWLRYAHRGGFFVVAENQRKLADWLTSNLLGQELGLYIGGESSIDKMVIKNWIEVAREHRLMPTREVVDGKGAKRLVEHMIAL